MPQLKGAKFVTLTIASGAAVSEEFDMSEYTKGILLMPAAWTAASVGFQVASASGGTFYPLYAAAATISEIDGPAVDKAYAFPAETANAGIVKLWSQDGAGANTNQAAARTIVVILKS